MATPHYQPPDASLAPRYTGINTFARCPHVTVLDGVDVAVVGVPFDTATSFRTGTRFGPQAVRSGSLLLRPWHPVHEVDVFNPQSVIDYGDLPITPGAAEKTTAQIHEGLAPLVAAGVCPIVIGGDHSIVLGELRAHAERHGPLGLVLLDAHADTWDQYYGERYFHGTPFRRAVEEGLIDPSRSLLAGMRGSLYGASDLTAAEDLGFEIITDQQLSGLAPERYSQLVRERLGDGPAFFSFDIDVFDPTFAPGTGTPEAAGLTPREGLNYIRSLAGIEFKGFDVVEVSPPYDSQAGTTALLGATVAYEFLALCARARQNRDAAGRTDVVST